MFGSEYISLLRHGNMSIYLRDINGAMSQHLLNIANIYICLKETGSKGVTEHMRCNVQFNIRESGIFINHPANCLIG